MNIALFLVVKKSCGDSMEGTLYLLLATGSEERGALGVGSIPVAILPSC